MSLSGERETPAIRRFVQQSLGDPYCLHVIRDPRGTAVSLVSQSWGPDSLPKAIAWVQSYYDQWFAVRDLYAAQGIVLEEMRIEGSQTGRLRHHSEWLLWFHASL